MQETMDPKLSFGGPPRPSLTAWQQGMGLFLANQIEALGSFGVLCSVSSRNHQLVSSLSLSRLLGDER